MKRLCIEHRTLGGNLSLSGDIAGDLLARLRSGGVAIVSKQPAALLASVRKQWLQILRRLERERASTLDAQRIAELTRDIARMQSCEFSTEAWGTAVSFATAEQLLATRPLCNTLYVATPTDRDVLREITSNMPANGMVIIYGVEHQ